MDALVAAGIEVVALADHNSVSWVDTMVAAGKRHGVVVFPGFEVTSASGSDGAHLIVFGDPSRTQADLERLLYTVCAYDDDHPLFNPSQPTNPAPSPRTLDQILNALPDGYLAIAPHAFGDNGIASQNTVSGSLRWKALHHDRLGAIDVGDVSGLLSSDASGSGGTEMSWRERFVRRKLNDFPCLRSLAFVSTSDAYSLEELGRRYTWIRMEKPSLEGMRQAFLDFGARVICDWDGRLAAMRGDPNSVTHAWVEGLTLADITTARDGISVKFDPRLTVLIGGRGAGKSTVVAGLRSLYGDVNALPAQAREEAVQFSAAVFADATLAATHRLAHSGERQLATWRPDVGSETSRDDGRTTATEFKVRVISQKELFERAANTPGNPHAISQNLLVLVDDALAASGATSPAEFDATVDEARTSWVSAVRLQESERLAIAKRPQVAERLAELSRQVAAFDDEANRARRSANDARIAEERWFDAAIQNFVEAIGTLVGESERLLQPSLTAPESVEDGSGSGLPELVGELSVVRQKLHSDIRAAGETASDAVDTLIARRGASRWQRDVDAAKQDADAYLRELAAQGLEPDTYEDLRAQLILQTQALAELDRRAADLPSLEAKASGAWQAYEKLLADRDKMRKTILDEIAERSGMLRFKLQAMSDTTSWVAGVRQVLNLRADGYLEDVPALAEWLWAPGDGQSERLVAWRDACVTGSFSDISKQARLRQGWADRLRGLDPVVRTRLAGEVAGTTVSMEFRRDGADGSDSWEPLTSGSPGQRSAAMLSFVLNHGSEPLVLDQPEDDLDTEWITELVVEQLRLSRWTRQIIVITHNANIPVNADAERVIVMENMGDVQVRTSRGDGDEKIEHVGALENPLVRSDIQQIMEGGVEAFVRRERRYNNELNSYRAALKASSARAV